MAPEARAKHPVAGCSATATLLDRALVRGVLVTDPVIGATAANSNGPPVAISASVTGTDGSFCLGTDPVVAVPAFSVTGVPSRGPYGGQAGLRDMPMPAPFFYALPSYATRAIPVVAADLSPPPPPGGTIKVSIYRLETPLSIDPLAGFP